MFAFFYEGKISREKIYEFGEVESQILEDDWELIKQTKNRNGFAWYEVYEADLDFQDIATYSFIGKNANSQTNYLFFFAIRKDNLRKYKKEFNEWIYGSRCVQKSK